MNLASGFCIPEQLPVHTGIKGRQGHSMWTRGVTLPQLVGAGLEPGILAREAGALTRNAKGYSL